MATPHNRAANGEIAKTVLMSATCIVIQANIKVSQYP